MPSRAALLAAAVLAAALLSACAGHKPPQPDYDPWEGFNRKMFWFNDKLDVYGLEPVARGWNFVVPNRVQHALTHFFTNLRFPIVFPNNLLQGKPHAALEALASFQINTFIGLLGFFDVASEFGLKPQDEDTGQTLGVWDIAPGPYLVLPLLGPSSARDAVGLAGDAAFGFYTYFITVPYVTIGATAINVVNTRARNLETVRNAKDASLDFYTFVRNAYVQRRWKQINDTISGGTGLEEENLYNEEIYENYLEGDTQ